MSGCERRWKFRGFCKLGLREQRVSSIVRPMRHVKRHRIAPAAAYASTGTSRRQKPAGFLRLDIDQALARRCVR
jgi:hypothetical protein